MPKVLIVDDSPDLLDFLSLFLKVKKYDVETATSKAQIEDSLPFFVPDIILLDVRLHGEDGREICKYIKSKTPYKHIPIILLSASPELLKDYRECKACDVIEKPFDIQTVLEKINNQLAVSQQ